MSPRRIAPAAAAALVMLLAIAGPRPAAAAPAPRALRVGTVMLRRCTAGRPGFCGAIRRPLDPHLSAGPTIGIHVDFVPARDTTTRRTIVAVEGGPGFPSSGSYEEYTGTFRPLLTHENLLMVDNRGTGDSALIRCRGVDRLPVTARASGPAFDRLAGACGRGLDHRWRRPGGGYVHAADLFGTADAIADLRAVLRRLALGRVSLYGDSYGSWFAQAFAARYPGALRSVVLDSTYAITGLDPWYRAAVTSGLAAMARVCARDPGCRRAGRGSTPARRFGRLLARVRRHPVSAAVRTSHGTLRFRITARHLVDLFQNAGISAFVWRDLDASVRAALHRDWVPLARLLHEDDGDGGVADPGSFSDGAYLAVSCTDYPQLFSRTAAPATRRAQYAAHLSDAPRALAPFTAAQWTSMSGYSEPFDTCLDWPTPVHAAPVPSLIAHPLPASVAVLIVGGDLDDLTPLSQARRFGPKLGADVQVVDLRNTVHVTSEGDSILTLGARCARAIIDRFTADPHGLLRAGCAARIPPIQTPGADPRRLTGAVPATVVRGPRLSRRVRRAVTVAAAAFADVTIRHAVGGGRRGVGLRGGTDTVARGGRFTLHAIRWVRDAEVSGTGTYRRSDGASRARLTVRAGRLRVRLTVGWDQRSRDARARVGTTVLSLPAP
jgi:pimeloyl-ACP methyl ester carboxylesterase